MMNVPLGFKFPAPNNINLHQPPWDRNVSYPGRLSYIIYLIYTYGNAAMI